MSIKAGRKTNKEKLEMLKDLQMKKLGDRDKLNEEIKDIAGQIKEIEQIFLLQEAEKLKEVLGKIGMSITDVSEVIESGKFDKKLKEAVVNKDISLSDVNGKNESGEMNINHDSNEQ